MTTAFLPSSALHAQAPGQPLSLCPLVFAHLLPDTKDAAGNTLLGSCGWLSCSCPPQHPEVPPACLASTSIGTTKQGNCSPACLELIKGQQPAGTKKEHVTGLPVATKMALATVNDHRRNLAEHAIRTFKEFTFHRHPEWCRPRLPGWSLG